MTTTTTRPQETVAGVRKRAIARILNHDNSTVATAVDDAIKMRQAAGDSWLDQPETRRFIRELLIASLNRHERCSVCQGRLIGLERFYGTCGHCGGRSSRP